jgi:hypothetical protein
MSPLRASHPHFISWRGWCKIDSFYYSNIPYYSSACADYRSIYIIRIGSVDREICKFFEWSGLRAGGTYYYENDGSRYEYGGTGNVTDLHSAVDSFLYTHCIVVNILNVEWNEK